MTTTREIQSLNSNTKKIVFWICTGIIALQSLVGAILDLSGNPDFASVAINLGYPPYLLYILGVWRVLAFIAILVPKLPRIKEWAYAGLFFDFTGAAASHLIMGDGFDKWVAPMVFSFILMVSWALRPDSRKLQGSWF